MDIPQQNMPFDLDVLETKTPDELYDILHHELCNLNIRLDLIRDIIKVGIQVTGARAQKLLAEAVKSNNTDVVKLFFTSGFEINSRYTGNCIGAPIILRDDLDEFTYVYWDIHKDDRYSILHLASRECSSEMIILLLRYGADLDARDSTNRIPLYQAVIFNNVDVIYILIENGSDINVKDNFGLTPLHLATFSNNIDAVKALISRGADVNVKNIDGYTPLHLAIHTCSYDIIKYIIYHGGDLYIVDKYGKSPWDYMNPGMRERVEYTIMGERI